MRDWSATKGLVKDSKTSRRATLNAPTKLMKDIGYGKDYAYDHEAEDGFSGANYWPEEMEPQAYYRPVERGFEREVLKRLEWWDKRRKELRD